jgi:hypothetical protein
MEEALRLLAACAADVLVVSYLDRLRSRLLDFASLMDRSQREA